MTDERRRAADRLDAALPALARLVALHQQVPDEEIAAALGGPAGRAGAAEHDPTTFDAARRLVAALGALRRGVEAARQLAVESLALSGLSESAVLEAVETVAGSSAPDQAQPLSCTVERLDLGTLALDATGRTTFELTGGPGRIVAEHPQLVVEPLQFGPGVTRIQVEATPLGGPGVVLTSLRAVTPCELLEVPVFARWAVSVAAGVARSAAAASAAAPPPAVAPTVVKTLLVVSRVTGFPRALGLQRAVQQIPGVTDAKAIGYEHGVLNLQVQHEARVNLADHVTHLRGHPLKLIESSLGRLQLAAEGR